MAIYHQNRNHYVQSCVSESERIWSERLMCTEYRRSAGGQHISHFDWHIRQVNFFSVVVVVSIDQSHVDKESQGYVKPGLQCDWTRDKGD